MLTSALVAERPEAIDSQQLLPDRAGLPAPPWLEESGEVPFTSHLCTPSHHLATPGVCLAFLEGTNMKCRGHCHPGSGRWDFRRRRCPAQLPLATVASNPHREGPVPQASWVAIVRSTPQPSFWSPPALPGPASLGPSSQPAPLFLPSKLPGLRPIVPLTLCRGHRQVHWTNTPGKVH